MRQATLAELLGAGPSYCQMKFFGLSEASRGTNSSKWAAVFCMESICPGMLCCVLYRQSPGTGCVWRTSKFLHQRSWAMPLRCLSDLLTCVPLGCGGGCKGGCCFPSLHRWVGSLQKCPFFSPPTLFFFSLFPGHCLGAEQVDLGRAGAVCSCESVKLSL